LIASRQIKAFPFIGIIVLMIILSGFSQGSMQVYEPGSAKIKIDLPMKLSLNLKSGSSENWIDL